ncbi:OLC1v1024943C1 [Oldenlandia corymbosa var. corymbosa]|uniref:OLC1v1024943C1 n=1 Tax=Oldenlandia corymbosa var. corymbosa TaxID=529605 RepID=A0AAV1C4A6_OLDCO|nr:OLC1v1024943C1 [Oldenlandia corymbosa var. corymbosa]
MNNCEHVEVRPSRSSGDGYIAEGHGGGQNDDFDSSDEDDASDGTYVESEEEVDYQTDVSDETDLEEEEQEQEQKQCRTYSRLVVVSMFIQTLVIIKIAYWIEMNLKLRCGKFIWQPYEGVEIPERCTRGWDYWQSNTWLICWDIVEPHQVDRMMRQFGLKQLIPPQPMIAGFKEWEKLHKYGRTRRAGNNWEFHHREYIEKWNNRANSIVAGSLSGQSSTDDDYLTWYDTNTIKFIKDPNKYNFQEEGYLCMDLILELAAHAMSALSLGAHELPILKPTQSLVDIPPQPSQPVGKVHKRNIPYRGIGGGRKKIMEEEEDEEEEYDFELNADLLKTPTVQNEAGANQGGEPTSMDVDVTPPLKQTTLPLALGRPRRKIKKVNHYTPSTAQAKPPLEEE